MMPRTSTGSQLGRQRLACRTAWLCLSAPDSFQEQTNQPPEQTKSWPAWAKPAASIFRALFRGHGPAAFWDSLDRFNRAG